MDAFTTGLRVFALLFAALAFILLTFAFRDDLFHRFPIVVLVGSIGVGFWSWANRRQAAADKARKEAERAEG